MFFGYGFSIESLAETCVSTETRGLRESLESGSCAPEMLLIPAGNFQMGASNAYDDEKPVHKVNMEAFYIGRYEVTFEEYDHFCEQTQREKISDNGWGRGKRPVINVSWHDAMAYTKWLSAQTKQEYRLPTEAEWEYSARAGSSSRYSWGESIGSNKANCLNNASGDKYEHTAPVGSFPANAFGLYDMTGNVEEWTCSKKTDTYTGSETQCTGNALGTVVLRGGSWNSNADYCRVSNRVRNLKANWVNHFGFRVVRTLTGGHSVK
jgi:formylglycine-generating enzyme required for sulfatase activity